MKPLFEASCEPLLCSWFHRLRSKIQIGRNISHFVDGVCIDVEFCSLCGILVS